MNEKKRKTRNKYMREYMRQYRAKNPEKIKQIMLRYYTKLLEADKAKE